MANNLPAEMVIMIYNDLDNKSLRDLRLTSRNLCNHTTARVGYVHLRKLTLIIHPDCMTRLENIANNREFAAQIETLAIEPQQISWTKLSKIHPRNAFRKSTSSNRVSIYELIRQQKEFLKSGDFSQRLANVLRKLPYCKEIRCTETKYYSERGPEDVEVEEVEIPKRDPKNNLMPAPRSEEAEPEVEEEAETEDETDTEDDSNMEDEADSEDEDEDEDFGLIGRMAFCKRLSIQLVAYGLEPPTLAFEQTTLVEVMGAIFSSGIALETLLLCPPGENRWLRDSSLQKIVNDSRGVQSDGRVQYPRGRLIPSLRVLQMAAEAEPEHDFNTEDDKSASKTFLLFLPGIFKLTYECVCQPRGEIINSRVHDISLIRNLPVGPRSVLHELNLYACFFSQENCIQYLQHLPYLRYLSFGQCTLQAPDRWENFLLDLRGLSDLEKLTVWNVKEYEQLSTILGQERWRSRYVCFEERPDEGQRYDDHKCRDYEGVVYKARSKTKMIEKLEEWAELAHTCNDWTVEGPRW